MCLCSDDTVFFLTGHSLAEILRWFLLPIGGRARQRDRERDCAWVCLSTNIMEDGCLIIH